ncbi:DUF11 domain-containing protein [Spirosoma taeanense]|uniref:DUF11 domain-containing protein n=1 Tax=Spirosoma taeanense TaxID=2735870 RepID=A0A6M5YD84_9BACT|nr:DUF11 domain-containing protein [Spirosoma taeanense]QJW92005.1 DUF11 domain-containing protein [Spirosoma taeanense]
MSSALRWVLLIIGLPYFAFAQLQISYPMPRLVVQRGADNNGRLYLSGRLGTAVDRVEARLTPVATNDGTATDWQTVQINPANNVFLGYITGKGGWYVLTVRTLIGNTVTGQATVQPVGIGEVFITAGQSNSRGLGVGDNDLGTATDRVNAIDTINHYYPPNANALFSSGDPLPVPVYKPLTAGRRVFPMAESSWVWGELGDYIVYRYNVPVVFYVAGWDGSTIDNWLNSANGIPSCNAYYCVENWPNLQPYTNLKNILGYYGSTAGIRAVLWHQGEAENDVARDKILQYADRLRALIQKSRQDFGGRPLPWVVARASFNGTSSSPDVVAQQEAVIATPGFNAFQGPYNDTIVNRNAGTPDVHFRNILRPSPHPRYYLNPGSIPADMGMSRYARNWSNSLNDGFFQNALPSTPTQFAVTETVADYLRPGDSLRVSFQTVGTFAGDNQWQVQLLDSLGKYVGVLGSGLSSPVAVKLPDTLTTGRRYQVRVVATSPVFPAVPSNLFRVGTPPSSSGAADLSLSMGISQRTPGVNDTLTISLYIRNAGPNPATNIQVRNRLPSNLSIVSASGLAFSGSTLTGTVVSLNPNATVILSFRARPLAAGTYRNAAEIAQVTNTDPDSQPNSGTGDGQDDTAELNFRTRQAGLAVFTSPNPNQAPLPSVQDNQPAADLTKADVSLSLSVSNRSPRLNDTITYTLWLTNRGGMIATGLNVTAYLPAGQTFISSNDMAPGGGGISGGLSSLDVNSTATLQFRAKVTALGRSVCKAQITAASRPDPDSVPGNGTSNGEDDTSSLIIRVK